MAKKKQVAVRSDDDAILSHVAARAADRHRRNDMDPPPTFPPPVSVAVIAKVERDIGFPLPPLLKRVYSEVGDGWFGPGYGLWGAVSGHYLADEKCTLADVYHANHHGDWPDGLVPLADWGCSIFSCVDCTLPRFPMVRSVNDWYDPVAEKVRAVYLPEGFDFREWLASWAEGKDVWATPTGV